MSGAPDDISDLPVPSDSTQDISDLPVPPPDETVSRVAGLTARAVGRGVAELPSTVSNLTAPGIIANAAATARPIAHSIRQLLGWDPEDAPAPAGPAAPEPTPSAQYSDAQVEAYMQKHNLTDEYATRKALRMTPKLSSFIDPNRWADAVDYFADKAGIARPATPTERVLSKAAEGVPSAALAPEAPVLGAVSSALGGGASQVAAENDLGPGWQAAAGLAAGSVPALGTAAAGLTRTVARGAGTDAAAAMRGRMEDAAAAGTTLTAGQAGGSRVVQALEKTSGNMWGGGSIAKNAENQTKQLEASVNGIVDNLNPKGAALTPTGAGEAINTGVASTKKSMRDAETAAYDKVDQLVPKTTPINVSASTQKAADIAVPTSNEALNAATVSPKIKAINAALSLYTLTDGTMPYADLTRLRTHVGSMIDRSFAPADPQTNGALKQLYASLSEDLNAGASTVSPEAQAAVKAASTLYKTNKAQRDALDKVVNSAGGPEAIFQAATGQTKAGATKISDVMSALDPENANVVRATVLHRMGRAIPSKSNPAESFDANTLLTNWNKMSSEAKNTLFGSSGASGDLRKSLDSITNTVGTLRNAGHTLANPSGTASAGAHALGLWGLLTEAGTALFSGHLKVAAASVGAGAGAAGVNALLSRALVNPRTARWIATTTKLPQHAIPNAVNQLSKMGAGDPDARDLATELGRKK